MHDVGSLLLLGVTVGSFGHLLLGLSNHNKGALTRVWRWCQVQPSQKERAIGAVHCKNEEMLLRLLRWRCIESVSFACPIHEKDQRSLAYGGGALCHGPPQTLKIKKCINSMHIFRCNLRNFRWNFAKFSQDVSPDPSTMVVLKLICDVTR